MNTLYTVGHRVYQLGVTDSHGNPVDTWADSVDVPVYGWYTPTIRDLAESERAGQRVDLVILAPTFAADTRDRFVVDGLEFEANGGPADYDHGPFGYAPGCEVRCFRVEG